MGVEATSGTAGLDVDALINRVCEDYAKGDGEDKKVTKARVHVRSGHIRDKRQERIDNLTEQMKGVSGGSGGCLKVLKVVFKIIDFLIKPLSALSLGSLKMDLSKTLSMLEEAKKQGKLLGLKINGDEILKALQNFKTLLSNDMQTLKEQDDHSAKEAERVMQILDEISQGFEAVIK